MFLGGPIKISSEYFMDSMVVMLEPKANDQLVLNIFHRNSNITITCGSQPPARLGSAVRPRRYLTDQELREPKQLGLLPPPRPSS